MDQGLRDAGNQARVRRIRPPAGAGGRGRSDLAPALSRRLFQNAATPDSLKRYHAFAGASHNDVPAHRDFRAAYAEFTHLVTRHATNRHARTDRVDTRYRQNERAHTQDTEVTEFCSSVSSVPSVRDSFYYRIRYKLHSVSFVDSVGGQGLFHIR
jgi:cytidylate kinase